MCVVPLPPSTKRKLKPDALKNYFLARPRREDALKRLILARPHRGKRPNTMWTLHFNVRPPTGKGVKGGAGVRRGGGVNAAPLPGER